MVRTWCKLCARRRCQLAPAAMLTRQSKATSSGSCLSWPIYECSGLSGSEVWCPLRAVGWMSVFLQQLLLDCTYITDELSKALRHQPAYVCRRLLVAAAPLLSLRHLNVSILTCLLAYSPGQGAAAGLPGGSATALPATLLLS